MRKKRNAQASGGGAAVFIAVLAFLMVLYILFLPPEDRAELLGTSTGSSGSTSTGSADSSSLLSKYNETMLAKSPGQLDYLKFDEYEHDISPINLYKSTESAVMHEENPFIVRNGWFDSQGKIITFDLDDPENMNNILLTFESKKNQGRIRLSLNDNVIFEDYVTEYNVGPLTLPKEMLSKSNVLKFEVSEVGWKFWTTNEYSINSLKVVADITDVSRQSGMSVFYASYEEVKNLKTATLKFNPNCNSNAGILYIKFNNREIYNAVPDCGMLNKISVPIGYVSSGENSVEFRTEQGSYLIDQIKLVTKLTEPNNPTYYFDLGEELFKEVSEKPDPQCGEIDGVCPEDCEDDDDKDCCFNNNNKAFWCDVKPADNDDRCVSFIDEKKCDKCLSGYEDIDGEAPEKCEGKCGDDEDDVCPQGCSMHYDADCCYKDNKNESTDYYFCHDLPTTGTEYTCLPSVRVSQCLTCETGYRDDGGSIQDTCRGVEPNYNDDKVLKDGVHVNFTMSFVDDEDFKEVKVLVNGHTFYVDTYDSEFYRRLDAFVEPGTNSVKLIPQSTMDIRQVKITLQD